jgi:hypothetical protein
MKKTESASVELQIGSRRVPVVAFGDLAIRLSEMPKNTFLRATGRLRAHAWLDGRKKQQALDVELLEIKSCQKPQTCFSS